MDRNREPSEERWALMRLVVLLLSLANHAEIACCRDVKVARLVLSILYPADHAISDFLGTAGDVSAEPGRSCEVYEELACLAVRFRFFAAFIAGWARLACPFLDRENPASAGDVARFLPPQWLTDTSSRLLPVPLFDTS